MISEQRNIKKSQSISSSLVEFSDESYPEQSTRNIFYFPLLIGMLHMQMFFCFLDCVN